MEFASTIEFPCKWDWCRERYISHDSLVQHVLETHIPEAQFVKRRDVPLLKKTEQGFSSSHSHPTLAQIRRPPTSSTDINSSIDFSGEATQASASNSQKAKLSSPFGEKSLLGSHNLPAKPTTPLGPPQPQRHLPLPRTPTQLPRSKMSLNNTPSMSRTPGETPMSISPSPSPAEPQSLPVGAPHNTPGFGTPRTPGHLATGSTPTPKTRPKILPKDKSQEHGVDVKGVNPHLSLQESTAASTETSQSSTSTAPTAIRPQFGGRGSSLSNIASQFVSNTLSLPRSVIFGSTSKGKSAAISKRQNPIAELEEGEIRPQSQSGPEMSQVLPTSTISARTHLPLALEGELGMEIDSMANMPLMTQAPYSMPLFTPGTP